MLEQIVEEWHASIGKAILENWEFPESMAQAVGEQEEISRHEPTQADLSDVLAVAILMSRNTASDAGARAGARRLAVKLASRPGMRRAPLAVMRDSATRSQGAERRARRARSTRGQRCAAIACAT
jgi:hypothetical protein